MRLVGETNAARNGLSLELPGLVSPVLAVEIGVRPRRELWRVLLVFHAEEGGLVLREPEDEVVGFALGRESLAGEEVGGRLIDTVRALGGIDAWLVRVAQ